MAKTSISKLLLFLCVFLFAQSVEANSLYISGAARTSARGPSVHERNGATNPVAPFWVNGVSVGSAPLLQFPNCGSGALGTPDGGFACVEAGGGGGVAVNTHQVWVSTSGGTDASSCGTVTAPCATIAYANGLITGNSSTNQFDVIVAPGVYTVSSFVLKSWVNYIGLSQYGTQLVVTNPMTYDSGYDSSGSAPTSIQNMIIANDPVLTGSATVHNPAFIFCILQNGLTLSGANSFSPWGSVIANVGATITDVYSVFSRLNSWEGTGGLTYVSATLSSTATWDFDEDRFLFGVTVSSTSGFMNEMQGSGDVEGPVALTSTNATFTGNLTAGGTSLVLSGGATASQYSLVGGGNGAVGSFPILESSGQVSWSSTIPNAASITWATSGMTPATSGRLNFTGDGIQTWFSMHYSGVDYAFGGTDGGGNVYLGTGALPGFVVDVASQILLDVNGNYLYIGDFDAQFHMGGLPVHYYSSPTFFDSNSNVQIGNTTADYGGSQGTLVLSPLTTAPSSFPSGNSVVLAEQNGLQNNELFVTARGVQFSNLITPSGPATKIEIYIEAPPSTSIANGSGGAKMIYGGQNGGATTESEGNGGNAGIVVLQGMTGGHSSSGVGGNGSDVQVISGPGGSGGTPGADGNLHWTMGNDIGDLMFMAGGVSGQGTPQATGLGLQPTTYAMPADGGAPTWETMVYPVVQIDTVTLSVSCDLILPGSGTPSSWYIDISQVTFASHTLGLKNGSTTCCSISALSAGDFVYVQTYGGSTCTCGQF